MADPNDILNDLANAHKKFTDRMDTRVGAIEAALNDNLRRRAAAELGGSLYGSVNSSWGATIVNSEKLDAFRNMAGKGRAEFPVGPMAAITSDGASSGDLIVPDRKGDIVLQPRQRLRVRSLLGQGRTSSNVVEYPRQVTRDNQAATAAEATLKPESNYAFEAVQTPVQVIAHWIAVTKQAMDDADQLQTTIDGELRYGLAYEEEQQLLLGDGTGSNLLGLIPQATAYDATGEPVGATKFDLLLRGIAQAEAANLPATGIVVNSADWYRLQGLKDTQERYIGSGPMGSVMPSAWGLDVVPSNSMPAGKFLVGNFANAATVYDRMQPVVLISSEDRDNFVKNMLTVLCEERIALAVRRPEALIYGDYSAAAG